MLEFIDGEFYDEELSLLIREEMFIGRFGLDWGYEVLYNHENATPAWKDTFDSWKSRGIIE